MPRLINRRPARAAATGLAVLPFLLAAVVYLTASQWRLAANPDDKLLPSPAAMVEAVGRLAFEPDRRSGGYVFWRDTAASLGRLLSGVGWAALIGLVFGVAVGLLPYLRAALTPFIAVLSMIPPLAVLPILFIVLGLGETAKIALIAIGIAPFLIRDLALQVEALPAEQLIKAQTLGANTAQIVCRVVLPQALPRLIDAVRLALGSAWLFLIAAEAIAATEGLGYRIFLVRLYLAMDVILPYVAWITVLAYAMDWALRLAKDRLFPWARAT
ncbi:MAG: ABC transporter permease [Gammaproteobacteria bacterium]|nr:MAG: ABC transporter permease [Gammaproteobacteria bacterium]